MSGKNMAGAFAEIFALEWIKVVKALKKSGYDLDKIQIACHDAKGSAE